MIDGASAIRTIPSIITDDGNQSQVGSISSKNPDLTIIESVTNIFATSNKDGNQNSSIPSATLTSSTQQNEPSSNPGLGRSRAMSISKQALTKAVLISTLSRSLTINFDASKDEYETDTTEANLKTKYKSSDINNDNSAKTSAFSVGVTSSILIDGFQLNYSACNPENILYSTFFFKHNGSANSSYQDSSRKTVMQALKKGSQNNSDPSSSSSQSLDSITDLRRQKKDSDPSDPVFIALTHDSHKLSVYDTHARLPSAGYQSVPGNTLITAKVIDSPDSIFIKKGIRAIVHITKFNFFLTSGESVGMDAFNNRYEWITSFVTPDIVLNLKYIENSDCVVTSDASNITVWTISCVQMKSTLKISLKEMRRVCTHENSRFWIRDLYVDENERIYAVFEHRIFIFDCNSGEIIRDISNPYFRPITRVMYHPTHRYLLAGFKDGCIKIWNTSFIVIHHFNGHSKAITSLVKYPYEGYFMSSSLDGTIRLWHLTNFSEIYCLQVQSPIYNLTIMDKSSCFIQLERTIMVWSFNHFHQEFMSFNSEIKSVRLVKHEEKDARLLIRCVDASIYLLSPIDGSIITACLPVIEASEVEDIHHSLASERIYILLKNRTIHVVSTTTNPCIVVDSWNSNISIQEDIITMALYDQYPRNLLSLKYKPRSFVFCGTRNGQILLFNRNGEMQKRFQLSNGPILNMNCCSKVDILANVCSDNTIRLVKITPQAHDIIQCTNVITSDYICRKVLSVGNLIMVAFDEGMIHICLNDEKKIIPHPKPDHLDNITEIGFREKLGLFCTSSVDGFIKTWTSKNSILREMKFNHPITSVCMINNQADIVFPIKSRLQIVRGKTHIPPALVGKLPNTRKKMPESMKPAYSYQQLLYMIRNRTQEIENLELSDKQLKYMEKNLKYSCFGHERGLEFDIQVPNDLAALISTGSQDSIVENDRRKKKNAKPEETFVLTEQQIKSILDFKATLMKMKCEEEDYRNLKAFIVSELRRRKLEQGLAPNEIQIRGDDILHVASDLFKNVIDAVSEKMDSYSMSKSMVRDKTQVMDVNEEDETLKTGGYRPRFESHPQPMEDLSQLETFSRNYKNLLTRMNIVTHDLGELYCPIAPDGYIPNSNLRANLYAWLFRKGLVDRFWRSEAEKSEEAQKLEIEATSKMHRNRDYRHKLLRLLSSLPTDVTSNPDLGFESPKVPNYQRRRMTRMNALSPKARTMIRQRVAEHKEGITPVDSRPSSRGTHKQKPIESLELQDPLPPLPQYLTKALERKIIKEDQIYSMDSKTLHRKLKIDETPDGLIPLLLDLFEKGDSLSRCNIVDFMTYVQKEFGFRRISTIIEYFTKHLVNRVDENYSPAMNPNNNNLDAESFDSSELKYRTEVVKFLGEYAKDSLSAFEALVILSGSKMKNTKDIAQNILSQWGMNDVKDTIYFMENVNKAISEMDNMSKGSSTSKSILQLVDPTSEDSSPAQQMMLLRFLKGKETLEEFFEQVVNFNNSKPLEKMFLDMNMTRFYPSYYAQQSEYDEMLQYSSDGEQADDEYEDIGDLKSKSSISKNPKKSRSKNVLEQGSVPEEEVIHSETSATTVSQDKIKKYVSGTITASKESLQSLIQSRANLLNENVESAANLFAKKIDQENASMEVKTEIGKPDSVKDNQVALMKDDGESEKNANNFDYQMLEAAAVNNENKSSETDPILGNNSETVRRPKAKKVSVPDHIPMIGGTIISKDEIRQSLVELPRTRVKDIINNPVMMIQEMNRYLDLKKALEELRSEYESNVQKEQEELNRKEEERRAIESLKLEREQQQRLLEAERIREEMLRREEIERIRLVEKQMREERLQRELEEERKRQEELRAHLTQKSVQVEDPEVGETKPEIDQSEKPTETKVHEPTTKDRKRSKSQRIMDNLNERIRNVEGREARDSREFEIMKAVALARKRQLLPIDRVNVNGYLFEDAQQNGSSVYYPSDSSKFDIEYEQDLVGTESNKQAHDSNFRKRIPFLHKTKSMPLHATDDRLQSSHNPNHYQTDGRPSTERNFKMAPSSRSSRKSTSPIRNQSYSPVRPYSVTTNVSSAISSPRKMMSRSMTRGSDAEMQGNLDKSYHMRHGDSSKSASSSASKTLQYASSRKLFIPSMSLADDQILARFNLAGAIISKGSSTVKLGPIAVRDFKGEAEDEALTRQSPPPTASPTIDDEERKVISPSPEDPRGSKFGSLHSTASQNSSTSKIDRFPEILEDEDDDQTVSTFAPTIKTEAERPDPVESYEIWDNSKVKRIGTDGKSRSLLQNE